MAGLEGGERCGTLINLAALCRAWGGGGGCRWSLLLDATDVDDDTLMVPESGDKLK